MRIFDNKEPILGLGAGAAQDWRKSSRSMTNGNCVEVARLSGEFVGVRDSMNPAAAVLGFTQGEWGVFVGGVRNGGFDRHR